MEVGVEVPTLALLVGVFFVFIRFSMGSVVSLPARVMLSLERWNEYHVMNEGSKYHAMYLFDKSLSGTDTVPIIPKISSITIIAMNTFIAALLFQVVRGISTKDGSSHKYSGVYSFDKIN